MVGRKTVHLLALLASASACGPSATPPPKGPTQPELGPPPAADAGAEPPAGAQAPQAVGPGMSPTSAIEVCMPEGERAYLSRLRCPGGKPPTVLGRSPVALQQAAVGAGDVTESQGQRASEAGESRVRVVDRFDLDCGDASQSLFVFLDMYHCPAPPTSAAPRGLELSPEGAAGEADDGVDAPPPEDEAESVPPVGTGAAEGEGTAR